MTRPRVYKTEAIVLRRVNLGEADSIFTLYTPNLGKIRAVAKGVRRPRSKLGGHLEPLTQSSLLIAQGRNLDIITQSQTIDSFLPLKASLYHAGCAIYMAELVDQFAPEHVESYASYRLLHQSLEWLCEARTCELVLRHFELHLLSLLGYQPELYECLHCRLPLKPGRNVFSALEGGVLCPDCGESLASLRPVSVDAVKAMRFLLASDRSTASRLRLTSELSQELEQLTRAYIHHILERDVKSTGFLDRVRKQQSAIRDTG
jgi:DNA repair protein RecO (recombination protein O)